MENKVINQLHMREMNLNEVLRIIRDHGPLTRRKLQEITGLSWGGTSQIVTRLLKQNLIVEEKDMTHSAGRKPTCLQINGNQNLILGIDINSGGLNVVIQNLKNEIIEQTEALADCTDKESLLESIFELSDHLYEKYKSHGIIACGISMQGAVDETTGTSLYLKECPDWKEIPLGRLFEERYKIPVYLAHDPDCLVASNVSMFGEDVILFRIDHGIGMSVFRDGNFIKAPGMLEIGNTLIRTESGEIQKLEELNLICAIEKKSEIKISQIVENEKGQVSLRDAVEHMALSIANVSILFHIPTILICGKLAEQIPEFYHGLEMALKNHLSGQARVFQYDAKRAASGAAWIAADRWMSGTI